MSYRVLCADGADAMTRELASEDDALDYAAAFDDLHPVGAPHRVVAEPPPA